MFTNVIHCEAKKLLKISPFCLKSVTEVLIYSKGGMSGIFFLLQNDLRTDKYVFCLLVFLLVLCHLF